MDKPRNVTKINIDDYQTDVVDKLKFTHLPGDTPYRDAIKFIGHSGHD